MSADLVRYEGQDSWAMMLGPVGDLANRIAGTEFVSRSFRGKPASVAAAILAGRELELGPLTALRGLQVIDGSVSMTAQMMAAKILAAKHRIEWLESTDRAAEVRITRGDGLGEAQARFTIIDAQRAGLAGKKNWQQYPRAMCRARALSECAGMIAPDCILGLESDDAGSLVEQPRGNGTGTSVVQIQPSVAVTNPEPESPEPDLREEFRQELARREREVREDTPPAPGTAVDVGPGAAIDSVVDLVTPAQIRKLNAQISELERIDGQRLTREQRRELIAGMAGVQHLASAKDLTVEEASKAIDMLDKAIGDRIEADSEDAGEGDAQ